MKLQQEARSTCISIIFMSSKLQLVPIGRLDLSLPEDL